MYTIYELLRELKSSKLYDNFYLTVNLGNKRIFECKMRLFNLDGKYQDNKVIALKTNFPLKLVHIEISSEVMRWINMKKHIKNVVLIMFVDKD